jgi:hypothetical protein
MEVGDETTLDPDVDADQVNSAEADRLASGAEKHDSLLGGDDPVARPGPGGPGGTRRGPTRTRGQHSS